MQSISAKRFRGTEGRAIVTHHGGGGLAMFDHISIGVANLERARRFYDGALAALGYTRLVTRPDMLGYGKPGDAVGLWMNQAARPVPPDLESGLHLCFAAPSQEAVAAFHAAGIAEGGRDHGGPGLRPNYSPSYYAAFVIDPDGYRLEAHFGAPG